MVYLGPIRRLAPQVKAKLVTGYEPSRGLRVSEKLPDAPILPPKIDRRRRQDRREGRRNSLLDSRSGQDRRKNNTHRINLDI